ncbi:hypothetical protein CRD60_00930 [Bifidobacterium aemilianum]|uniref:Uncharacterized protein n=1 Tax=Bifidobacterium aemilianum TaxID=2493120 RepID=A0A366KCR7_9BIFI|nr:hypothetical protein [Bifidobacterium aemilianum]RBP98461.1 hypothetical protein CRD60_00930 [Bifidobacterium aemilianum]
MTRVKISNKGFREYRRDPTVQAELNRQAQAWAARCERLKGKEKAVYEAVPAQPSGYGSIALVHTGNYEARVDNASRNTLLKGMGGTD